MRALLQRVTSASVRIDDSIHTKIANGILVFVGIENKDTKESVIELLEKIYNYRIFSDKLDKMNLSVRDIQGEVLIVSQFTLLANTQKGLRPDFKNAGDKQKSKELFDYMANHAKNLYRGTKFGVFAADMAINLCNDGPVTFILEN